MTPRGISAGHWVRKRGFSWTEGPTNLVEPERVIDVVVRVDDGVAPRQPGAQGLLAQIRAGHLAEGMAAVLPCYWIYWEVGKELKRRGSKNAACQR